nr:unnamed protein product [Callosobruchus analis]
MQEHSTFLDHSKVTICIHCNATFTNRIALHDHIIREHPDYIGSVTSKILECTHCTFKTTSNSHFARHMSNHSEAADSDNLSLCIHCNATFKSKTSLDDHTIREHPGFIASVSCKIHECPCCTYKTTVKGSFDRHMLKHPETVDSYKLSVCVHCDAKFKSKTSLDSHTIREHPDFIVSVSSKIHACAHCPYKTVMKANLDRHMSKHPESAVNYNLSICVHCNATYKSKKNLDDHIIRKHPDFIESISSKIHECTHCTYKTTVKGHLTEHMVQHTETADIYKLRCIHCDETFKRRAGLDEHIIKKHPHLIATITSKIHECTYCAYQTVLKPHFARHMLKHPETADNYKLKICVHCNAKFKSKASLDNHTVREHPDFVASVSNKLHECAHCTYKTTLKSNFSKHMWKHSKAVNSVCTHCEAKFKSKQKLDEHTLKKHPDLIASVSSKIHECIYCTYKTTRKDVFLRHMEDHPEAEDSYQHSTCIHCNAVFKRKRNLDDHIVRKHPDFIAFVSSKIHECTHCSYRTAMKANLDHHMLKHPETADSYRYIACVHCNATYKTKKSLDDHTIRKHPDSITCITSKVHKCAYCTYKTTVKGHFTEHMLKHSETTADIYMLRCLHCEATFKRKTGLDNHVIRKHPHFIASVSSKMHECTYCTYKTTMKSNFAKHLLKHNSNNLVRCIHCNATYKSRTTLNDHVIHNHPDFIASISSKIYQCKYCTYKTTRKSHFVKHSLVHPETVDSHKLSKCIHCNAIYKHKIGLDDHILRQHPELIASVSSKMHECTHCAFKTVLKANLALHMLEHHETADRCKFSTCVHCNTTFIHKQALSDHILTKHPESIGSVSSQIYECTLCAFRTVSKPDLDRHMVKHPETEDRCTFKACVHCNATFKSKTALNDHTLKKHPESIGSVSSKNIYECTQCSFKTVKRSDLARHMLKHPETANQSTFKSRPALDDHTLKKHPESIGSVASKNIYECTQCTFKTVKRTDLARHMLKHPADKRKCTVCNKAFRQKGKLDEHTVRKHPHLIASVTNKIHECTRCAFKTVMKASLARHVMKHPEIADSNKLIRCNHCNSTFKSKPALNDHIINRHPDFMASISSKIHQCKYCTYKTTWKSHFARHMLAHPETADSRKLSKCIRCNTEYKHKIGLDEHILRQHPELIASVSNKMHECTHCAFKTVFKDNLTVHMVEHHETADICVQCNATFKSRQGLNDHTLKKHPESIGSISSKIYECPQCTFKTVMKSYLTRHMLKHPETADRCKFSACVHCNATFKSKPSLVDHTLRKHPDSVESNSIRIYECTHCAYKTCLKRSFTKHILKHP